MTSPLDATTPRANRQDARQQTGAFEGLARISMPAAQAADLLRKRLDSFRAQSFLSYALIGSGVSIWVADNRGMRFHIAEADTRAIMESARRLLTLCATPDSDFRAIREASRFLYGALVEPVEYLLDADRTIFTHFTSDFPCIPFALLQNAKHEYLGDRYRCQIASKFPEATRIRRPKNLPGSSQALVVDTSFDSNASSPTDRRASDLQLLGTLCTRHHILDGATANAAAFSALVADADLLFLRAGWTMSARGPAIVLDRSFDAAKPDGALLEPSAIYLQEASSQWLDRCQLAVLDLAACPLESTAESTAASDSTMYGLRSLTRALHGAGIANILAPLWASSQESRHTLLRSLTSHMHLGMAVNDAAHKAATDIRNQPYWQHPHHWAGFQFCSMDIVT